MQKFQGELKKLLNSILAAFFPCHLMPSPSSLPALGMSVWKTYTSQMKNQSRVAVTVPQVPQKVLQNQLQSSKIKTRKVNGRNNISLVTAVDMMGR